MAAQESLLDELEAMKLTAQEWDSVHADLVELRTDPDDSPEASRLSHIVFEAKVRQRFHAGRSSSSLAPTKQTSALPWVGLVCAALLIAVGDLLGGGIILVAIVVLSVGVLGVAVAGSRVAHRNKNDDQEEFEPVVEIPAPVVSAIQDLRSRSK